MRRLSHSQVRMYHRCPQQWKLKYVDGLTEEPKPWFNLGRAVHAALEAFYDGRVAAPPRVEELEEVFLSEFEPEAYADDAERERGRADGLRMVREFHAEHADDFRPALAVEKRLDFELEGVRFLGFIDRVDRTEDDRLRIVDYKTGGGLDRDRAATDPQLTLYQVGAEHTFGREVASLCLYHVPTQTPFEVDRHGDERVEALRRRIRTAARGIRDGAFEQLELDVPSAEEAAEMADRYGRLKEEIDRRQDEQEEIRDALRRYFEATGRRSVAGRSHRVKADRRVGDRFDDEEELREVLEPAGLWDRVLQPDWRAEEALLQDPEVPENLRERLLGLARERVSWRMYVSEVEPAEAEPSDGGGEGGP